MPKYNGYVKKDYCEKCKITDLPPAHFEIDHIIPRFLGGTDDHDNLWTLCIACHKDKTVNEDMPAIREAKRKAGDSPKKTKRSSPILTGAKIESEVTLHRKRGRKVTPGKGTRGRMFNFRIVDHKLDALHEYAALRNITIADILRDFIDHCVDSPDTAAHAAAADSPLSRLSRSHSNPILRSRQ